MNINHNKLKIREANISDSDILFKWWNDGEVMAHAGFPNGLNISYQEIEELISNKSDKVVLRHIIVFDNLPIGEMHYRYHDNDIYEIGIKICDSSYQNKHIGRTALSLFIENLFEVKEAKKIILDTNLNNARSRHVYELLGFKLIRINYDSFKDALDNLNSSVDYELSRENFIKLVE